MRKGRNHWSCPDFFFLFFLAAPWERERLALKHFINWHAPLIRRSFTGWRHVTHAMTSFFSSSPHSFGGDRMWRGQVWARASARWWPHCPAFLPTRRRRRFFDRIHRAKGIEPRGIEEGNNTRVCRSLSLLCGPISSRWWRAITDRAREKCLPPGHGVVQVANEGWDILGGREVYSIDPRVDLFTTLATKVTRFDFFLLIFYLYLYRIINTGNVRWMKAEMIRPERIHPVHPRTVVDLQRPRFNAQRRRRRRPAPRGRHLAVVRLNFPSR